jgi:hypothetical protein
VKGIWGLFRRMGGWKVGCVSGCVRVGGHVIDGCSCALTVCARASASLFLGVVSSLSCFVLFVSLFSCALSCR